MHFNNKRTAQQEARKKTEQARKRALEDVKKAINKKITALEKACPNGEKIVKNSPPSFCQVLGYSEITATQSYDTYKARETTEDYYYTSGYSGTIDSYGKVDLSPNTSSGNIKYWVVEQDKEDEVTQTVYVKVVQQGAKAIVESKECQLAASFGQYSNDYSKIDPNTKRVSQVSRIPNTSSWISLFALHFLYIISWLLFTTGIVEKLVQAISDESVSFLSLLPAFFEFLENPAALFGGIVGVYILGIALLVFQSKAQLKQMSETRFTNDVADQISRFIRLFVCASLILLGCLVVLFLLSYWGNHGMIFEIILNTIGLYIIIPACALALVAGVIASVALGVADLIMIFATPGIIRTIANSIDKTTQALQAFALSPGYQQLQAIIQDINHYSANRSSRSRNAKSVKKRLPTGIYVCPYCGYEYNPEIDFSEYGFTRVTAFEELPDDFQCPGCSASKEHFEELYIDE